MFIIRSLHTVPIRAMATKAPKPPGSALVDAGKTDSKDGSVRTKIDLKSNHGGVGYKPDKLGRDVYLNPLLTPPPRGPSTPEDFRNPDKLGHWFPFGFDYTDPLKDKYMFHEIMFFTSLFGIVCWWLFIYGPDLRDREWARREAFLRTHKREALGLPLIDVNVVDPDRVVLPTEEELGDFAVTQ